MLGREVIEVGAHAVAGDEAVVRPERLAVEEPLEIRLVYGAARQQTSLAVTMRTPGQDVELALGFLYSEGILQGFEEVEKLRHSGPSGGKRESRNVLTVSLKPDVAFDAGRLQRHFYATSSCGVCGKASLEALAVVGCPELPKGQPVLKAEIIHRLPEALREAQAVFEATGGLHAAAFFDPAGKMLLLREDVGRHNAVDKLIGAELLEGRLPLSGRVLMVSGRVGFELAQKALRAGAPVLAAVGAPSSLAVELAQAHGLTLLGFVRNERFNVYAGAERVPACTPRHAEASP